MRNRTTERPAKIPISTASIRKRWSSLNIDAQRLRFSANLRLNTNHSESFGRAADAGTAGLAFVIPVRPPASHGTFFNQAHCRILARRFAAYLGGCILDFEGHLHG